jgi:hypothetical protein
MNWPHDLDGEEGSEGKRKYDMAIIVKKVDEEADFLKYVDPKSFRTITDMHKVVGDSHR